MLLVANLEVHVLHNAHGGNDALIVASGAIEHDGVAALEVAIDAPADVDLADRVPVRELLDEICRGLIPQNAVGEQARVVVRVDRHQQRFRGRTYVGESQCWRSDIERRSHVTNENRFSPVLSGLCAIVGEAKVLEELDEPLLSFGMREESHVELIDLLPESVVEDDLEEALAKLEPIHLDLERANLQPPFRAESGRDVAVVLLWPFHFQVEERDELSALEADVCGLICFAREPLVERRATVVLAKAVEELTRDVHGSEDGLLDRKNLIIHQRRVLGGDLLQERIDREYAVFNAEDTCFGVDAAVFRDE